MAKPRKMLKVRLAEYVTPRNKWRLLIQKQAKRAQKRQGIKYSADDQLELLVCLYYKRPRALEIHDVDNRLKDIMDALQGRAGGPKARKPHSPVIPNDSQIRRVVIQKDAAPRQSRGLGHLTVHRFRDDFTVKRQKVSKGGMAR